MTYHGKRALKDQMQSKLGEPLITTPSTYQGGQACGVIALISHRPVVANYLVGVSNSFALYEKKWVGIPLLSAV